VTQQRDARDGGDNHDTLSGRGGDLRKKTHKMVVKATEEEDKYNDWSDYIITLGVVWILLF
jgi:hypothetical protein